MFPVDNDLHLARQLWWQFSESFANVVLLFWSVGRAIICQLVIVVSGTALGENESFDNRADGRIRRHRDHGDYSGHSAPSHNL